MPDAVAVSKSLEELVREVSRVEGQPAGKEEETSDESGASICAEVRTGRVLATTPPFAHAGRRDGRSEESLLEQRAVRTLAARRNYETAFGTFLKFAKGRALPLVEEVEIDGALVAYSNHCFVQGVQHHHGSHLLAAVRDRWPSFSRFWSRKLPRFHWCLKGW